MPFSPTAMRDTAIPALMNSHLAGGLAAFRPEMTMHDFVADNQIIPHSI